MIKNNHLYAKTFKKASPPPLRSQGHPVIQGQPVIQGLHAIQGHPVIHGHSAIAG